VTANIPKLRLLVNGTVIEGEQVGLEALSEVEQAGASELITFLDGAKRVLILQHPLIYGSVEQVRPRYLVVRQDQIQACEFVLTETASDNGGRDLPREPFDWAWDDERSDT